jgi:hypothetical protein
MQKKAKKNIQITKDKLNQWLISPIFYKQLLREQISKAQKDTHDLTVFLHF